MIARSADRCIVAGPFLRTSPNGFQKIFANTQRIHGT